MINFLCSDFRGTLLAAIIYIFLTVILFFLGVLGEGDLEWLFAVIFFGVPVIAMAIIISAFILIKMRYVRRGPLIVDVTIGAAELFTFSKLSSLIPVYFYSGNVLLLVALVTVLGVLIFTGWRIFALFMMRYLQASNSD